MKQILYSLLVLMLLAGCGNSPTSVVSKKLTGNIATDLKNLLPAGKVKVDIMDGIQPNPRRDELTMKFQNAVKDHYDWFLEYSKIIPEGEPMPYHENLGLTKTEYDELLNYLDNIDIISSGTENVMINIEDDIIHFKSQGKLAHLNSLVIDLKANVASTGGYKLSFRDTVNVTDDKNGLKSKWKGYKWVFYEPKDLDIDDLKDLSQLNRKDYKLTIGRLEKTGKTYLSLEGKEMENGVKTIAFEIPIVF